MTRVEVPEEIPKCCSHRVRLPRSVLRPVRLLLSAWVCAVALESPAAAQGREQTWRTELYPADWEPGPQQGQRPHLPDFSYAGYHRGEREIPDRVPGRVINAARPPYRADATGRRDSTDAIQRALDDAGHAGGGTVYLPAGRYLVAN